MRLRWVEEQQYLVAATSGFTFAGRGVKAFVAFSNAIGDHNVMVNLFVNGIRLKLMPLSAVPQ